MILKMYLLNFIKGVIMFKGKITKFPKNLDINIATAKRMYNQYSTCPFEILHRGSYETTLIRSETWRGKLHPWKFWEKNILLKKDHWKCLTCGTEWDSEPYPIDLKILKGE